MICPATRPAALAQLQAFLPAIALYPRDRNRVAHGHESVSRLSPAIRHRLITEDEVARAVLLTHSQARAEKFLQEIHWRCYWKSWLSLRPQVWEDYSNALLNTEFPNTQRIEDGHSGNPVIDHFTRELKETGYLHNHARMWYAAWWIHAAGLPWQSGAAFFHRHLMDGDPASNTLSWRWVAGSQTPGKAYLARRSNLEKHLSRELQEALAGDWADFDAPVSKIPITTSSHAVTQPALESHPLDPALRSGLWIHEEDLSPETSPLAALPFQAIATTAHLQAWEIDRFPDMKKRWLTEALTDAAARAQEHWQIPTRLIPAENLALDLVDWAKSNLLEQIATLRPATGRLADALPAVRAALHDAGISLALIDRPQDLSQRPLAKAGFFKFWESLVQQNLLPGMHQATLELFGPDPMKS